jgi:hypothetical protein
VVAVHLGEGAPSTLSAVIIGAVLATVGGFAATQLETFLRRREREHSAALLFGEVLSVVELLMDLTVEAKGRGVPYGPLTLRLVRAMAREIDIYERNREVLYELRDPGVRARIHTTVVRMRASLDGLIDFSAEIGDAELALAGMAQDHPARAELVARLADLAERREGSFDFAVDSAARIKPILNALQPIARQSFETHAAIAREL